MPVDNSELYALAHDFGVMPDKYVKKIRPIFNRTALEIKRGMQDDFKGSRHFKQVARSIDYDLQSHQAFGSGVLTAEIGPNVSRNPAASLAGIAYFGGSRGGGGTVRDPVIHAREQGQKMIGFLGMAAEGLL